MKVSIITPVLNSHEIVRRQLLHYERMNLPDDVEIIIVDDGSDPPLLAETEIHELLVHDRAAGAVIIETNEERSWTSSIARNKGAKIARGRNLLMVDVGYIIPKETIMEVREFTGQKMQFSREFGVLDENGEFTQDHAVLLDYGLLPERLAERGVKIPFHPNTFAMNRDVFFEIGGYDEKLVLRRQYPQGEDNLFKRRWWQWEEAGKGRVHQHQPIIYMFPRGQFCGDVDYNPHGLFHGLTRKTDNNVFWHRQLQREQEQVT